MPQDTSVARAERLRLHVSSQQIAPRLFDLIITFSLSLRELNDEVHFACINGNR